ncbi:MAG: hypothetical protein WDN10_04080 [bacterium]
MAKPLLLFLTDLTNGAEEEDMLIRDFLRRDFDVALMHPRDCEPFEDAADAIIIRNTWNTKDYGKPEPWYGRWRAKPWLPIHDDLYVREYEQDDSDGWKGYLLWLSRNGFPVIPTVDRVGDIGQLPNGGDYFIKPKNGFSGINARRLSRDELLALAPRHYLIQPFIDFTYEISFYYLDGKLQYVLYAPDTRKRWELEEFDPSERDIAFAKVFIDWDRQKRGIIRVDACRTETGDLLLTEVTDQGGVFLSVTRLSDTTRGRFLENLSRSIRAVAGT